MSDQLHTLKGIGEKTEKLFEKMGVCDLEQLLHYYPRTYDAITAPVPFDKIVPGRKTAVTIRIESRPVIKKTARTSLLILNLKEKGIRLEAVWFNMPYLAGKFKLGSVYVLRGKTEDRGGRLVMHQPELYTPAAYEEIQGSIRPVYSLTAGLSKKLVIKAVSQVLDIAHTGEYLSDEIRKKYSLIEINEALKKIHFPEDENVLAAAVRRLVFDEFFFYILGLTLLKNRQGVQANRFRAVNDDRTEQYLGQLPFRLTGAQQKAWDTIKEELSGEILMNRLLQGDVGSGKTVIAFLTMILMAENGHQAALMAPTEVLAVQHFKALQKAVENLPGIPAPVLLVGSLKAAEKRMVQEDIASGRPKLIVGTHALIQEKAFFKDLGLVITDEQHRFGVGQRSLFYEKGNAPNVLIMSATPIPRTLALILYGNMNVLVLDEMPADRLKIKNCVVDPGYRGTAWKFIGDEIKKGHQAYIVCPMIEVNEELDCEDVLSYTEKIKGAFPAGTRIEKLHGRMRPDEKNEIMARFSDGEIDILVSTTVIEVGVDVPNATVMMIENADRFGLAGLHQLRGRIGRGKAQSYCIFINTGEKEVSERLKILVRSNDGFEIASEDLKLRGQGDLFGLRQSGETGFELADPVRYPELLTCAAEASRGILSEDPNLDLDKNTCLKQEVEHRRKVGFSDTL